MKKRFKEMDLSILNEFEIENPIVMKRELQKSYADFFSYHPAKYEKITVHTLREAAALSHEGWTWDTNYDWYYKNICFYTYEALKKLAKELGKRKII